MLRATVLLLSTSIVGALPHAPEPRKAASLDWKACNLDFPESHKKIIEKNGDPVECSNLEVPLDYTEHSDNNAKLNLQLVRVKASKEPVKGSIIFAPGGPGISGVEEVSKKGGQFRDIFGGHWNVIGFDPRGTGRTMPFHCIDTNSTAFPDLKRRETFYEFETPQQDSYELLKSKGWKDNGIFVNDCYEANKENGTYLTTAFTARDMVQIIDALDEGGKLRYWGRSYGTILGQTFASMFPDKVERMLLDSVVLHEDYHSGTWFSSNRDTEEALSNFFKECIEAGAEQCPLAHYKGPETTVAQLIDEVGLVLQELLDNPVTLPDTYTPLAWWQPGGVSLYHELKYYLLVYLYRPDQFSVLYSIIEAMFGRNWSVWTEPAPTPAPNAQPAAPPAAQEIPWNLGINAFHGIACTDSPFRASKPEDMYNMIRAQKAQGSWADVFGTQLWPCAQWKFEAKERFEGPYSGINTSFPIMLVNSPYDPITPLSGAWESAQIFEKSRLLVHKGHGHGLMNHPSKCTYDAIKAYFDEGKLPEVGTSCEPDKSGFEVLVEHLTKLTEETQETTREKRSLDKSSLLREAFSNAKRELREPKMMGF